MRYDDVFVGAVAIILGIISLVIAFGPWQGPYQLRSVSAVGNRFGKPAARGVWILVAVVSILSGLAISNGIRPSYASPTHQHAE